MIRSLAPVLGLFLGIGILGAQDLGRTDSLWRGYLSETVRRGVPLLAEDQAPAVIPYWPALERARLEASSLEPGSDLELLAAWMELLQGDRASALPTLQKFWPKPVLSRFSSKDWGEALFYSWEPGTETQTWTQAWLGWEDKAYSPRGLVRGLEVLELADTSAVEPLLSQTLELYPEDRRFLPLLLRHPDAAVSAEGMLARDLAIGGWSDRTLRVLLDRDPSSRDLLLKAGYPASRLTSISSRDYATWLAGDRKQPPSNGEWTWDSDQNGRVESRLVFQDGALTTWTRDTADGGVWTLAFVGGQPDTLSETRRGATWTLSYEKYPWARTLEYRWGPRSIVYRFPALDAEYSSLAGRKVHGVAQLASLGSGRPLASVEPQSLGFGGRVGGNLGCGSSGAIGLFVQGTGLAVDRGYRPGRS